MKQTALYPGSFDPPSLGHLDIIERAARLVDHLIVGVAQRETKPAFMSAAEKIRLLSLMTKDLANVEVIAYTGLTVEFAASRQISHLVRGLRLTSAVLDEFQIALANRALSQIETIFILGDEKFSHVSSTIIREIARSAGCLEGFVVPEVAVAIKNLSGLNPLKM